MFTVYILKSLKTAYFYTGHTNNLSRRLEEHNNGTTRSIKYQCPWTVVYTERYLDRASAIKREKYLKSGHGRKELRPILNIRIECRVMLHSLRLNVGV